MERLHEVTRVHPPDTVEKGVEQLLPHAGESGAKLASGPLHPAFAAERSVLVTLRQTNDMLDRFDSPQVGVAR